MNPLTSLDFGGLVEARVMTGAGMSAARLRRAIWAGREPVARALLMVVVLAAIAAPAGALEQSAPQLRRVVSAGDPDWTVVWQAVTAESRGQFRLYGGPGLDSLQLMDIQQATPGLSGYRYRDGRAGVPAWYYQLRYVGSKGEELVLGSLRVDLIGLQPAPASASVPAQVVTALPATGPKLTLDSHRQPPPASVAVADSDKPEPDVPPPRAAA